MAVHIIPVNKLSAKALQEVIEEFISRSGTDYGAVEDSEETIFRQVKQRLEKECREPCSRFGKYLPGCRSGS